MGFVRKKNRLTDKKLYERNNAYFVTICAFERQYVFGDFVAVEEPLRFQENTKQLLRFQKDTQDLRFQKSQIGDGVEKCWVNLPNLFSDIGLGDFVMMPNHIHFVISLGSNCKYKNGLENQKLSDIVRVLKSLVWKEIYGTVNNETTRVPLQNETINDDETTRVPQINNICKQIWQKSFYDHIVRNEQDLARIREYIQNNPKNWSEDILNKENQGKYDAWIKRNDQSK